MKPGANYDRIFKMAFASVYPHYVTKVEKKGRTRAELHQVIAWLTGFDEGALQVQIAEPAIAVLQSIVVIKVDNRPADSELVSVLTVTASSDIERGEIDGPILASIISSMRISIPAEV